MLMNWPIEKWILKKKMKCESLIFQKVLVEFLGIYYENVSKRFKGQIACQFLYECLMEVIILKKCLNLNIFFNEHSLCLWWLCKRIMLWNEFLGEFPAVSRRKLMDFFIWVDLWNTPERISWLNSWYNFRLHFGRVP